MAEAPLVWLLLGARAGDNAQVIELAARLPITAVPKQLSYNALHALPNVLLGAGTASLTTEARSRLQPPWPDAVIAAGKRSVSIARWIKQQSAGRTKLIHIGRPRAPLGLFDLVVSTPQYGLPPDANVFELGLPLAAKRSVTAEEKAKWQREWAQLKQPLFAVAVGAAKFPIRLGVEEAESLAHKLNGVVDAAGGSAIVIASPRTDAAVMSVLASRLTVPHVAYASFQKANNPYAAALELSDRFIVTSDSASMIADGVTAGKPVDVFRLPVSSVRIAWSAKTGLGAALSRAGILQPPRAMGRIVDRLLAAGFVGELGGRPANARYDAGSEELKRRIMALLNSRA